MDRRSGTPEAESLIGMMDMAGMIETCEEWARWSFRGLVCCLALAGYGKARVISGRRTFERQVTLFGQGRKAHELAAMGLPEKYARPHEPRVTWLQPHESRHVQGVAIDVDFSEYEVEALAPIADICRQLGITWGGVWSVRDYSHFEK